MKPNLFQVLDRLEALERGWNSYDAEPMNYEILEIARSISGWLPHSMFDTANAIPCGDGSVQFEWYEDGGRRSMELGIISTEKITYIKCPNEDETTWEDGEIDTSDKKALQNLFDWWLKGVE